MKKINNKITLLNTIASLFLQVVSIISGLVIPRLILSSFGSDVNGLVSSITKFLSYIALVDGGISGVVIASLYKPLVKNDTKKISSILVTAGGFYKKIGFIYILYATILAIIYPLIFNTGFDFLYVFLLTIIISIRTLLQYLFSLTVKTLLNADKRIYVTSFVEGLITIAEILAAIVIVKVFPNIHVLKLITGLIFIIQPIIFYSYAKKHYKLEKQCKADSGLIKDRWNGFAVMAAAFIHGGTDVTVLTIFTNMVTVSIYSVFALVTSGIRNIVMALVSGLNPVIGHAYAKGDYKNLHQKLDLYEYIVFMLVSLIFSVAALLVIPFVMIYTHGVNDADYYQPLFGILILISEALYLLKWPHLNLAYSANKYKEISASAFIEAGINVVLSVALVPFLGLIGVAIGTIIAMLYRMIYHVHYTKTIIPNRPQILFYRKMLSFVVATTVAVGICLIIPPSEYNIVSWVWHALAYTGVIGIVLLLNSLLFFRKEMKYLKKYLIK